MSKVHLPDLSKDDLVQLVKRLNGQIKFLQTQGAPSGVLVGPNGAVNQNVATGDASVSHQHEVAAFQSQIKQLKQENAELNMRLKSSSEQIVLIREELTSKTEESRALGKQIAILSDQLVDSQTTVDQLIRQQQEAEEESSLRARIASANDLQGLKGKGTASTSSVSDMQSGVLSPKTSHGTSKQPAPPSAHAVSNGAASSSAKISATAHAERTIMNLQMRIIELEETLEFYSTIVQSQDNSKSLNGTANLVGDSNTSSISPQTDAPLPIFAAVNKQKQRRIAVSTMMADDMHSAALAEGEPTDTAIEELSTSTVKQSHRKFGKELISTKRLRQIIQQLYEECVSLRQEGDTVRIERNRLRKRLQTIDGLTWFASDLQHASEKFIVSVPCLPEVSLTQGEPKIASPTAYVKPEHSNPTPNRETSEGTPATIVHELGGKQVKTSAGAAAPVSEAHHIVRTPPTSTRSSQQHQRPNGVHANESGSHPSFLQSLLGTATKYTSGALPVASSLLGRGRTNNSSGLATPATAGTLHSPAGMPQHHRPSPSDSAYSPSHLPTLNFNALPDKNLKGTISSREQKLLDRTNAVEAYLEQLLQFNESRQRNYDELDSNRAELFASLNEKLQEQRDEILRLTKAMSRNSSVANLQQLIPAKDKDPMNSSTQSAGTTNVVVMAEKVVDVAKTQSAVAPQMLSTQQIQTDELPPPSAHPLTCNVGVSAFAPVTASVGIQTEPPMDECSSVGLSPSVSEEPAESQSASLVHEGEASRRRIEALELAIRQSDLTCNALQLEYEATSAMNHSSSDWLQGLLESTFGLFVATLKEVDRKVNEHRSELLLPSISEINDDKPNPNRLQVAVSADSISTFKRTLNSTTLRHEDKMLAIERFGDTFLRGLTVVPVVISSVPAYGSNAEVESGADPDQSLSHETSSPSGSQTAQSPQGEDSSTTKAAADEELCEDDHKLQSDPQPPVEQQSCTLQIDQIEAGNNSKSHFTTEEHTLVAPEARTPPPTYSPPANLYSEESHFAQLAPFKQDTLFVPLPPTEALSNDDWFSAPSAPPVYQATSNVTPAGYQEAFDPFA